MEQKPEVCVGFFVRNTKGEIALFRSPKWSHEWTFPGGHVEFGETVEEAVKREVIEELGVEAGKTTFVKYIENINNSDFHRAAHLVTLIFLCEPINTEFKIDHEEITDYKWVTIEEILSGDDKKAMEIAEEIKRRNL